MKTRIVGKNKLVDRGRRWWSARGWWSYRTGLDGKLMLFDRGEIHSGLDPKEAMAASRDRIGNVAKATRLLYAALMFSLI